MVKYSRENTYRSKQLSYSCDSSRVEINQKQLMFEERQPGHKEVTPLIFLLLSRMAEWAALSLVPFSNLRKGLLSDWSDRNSLALKSTNKKVMMIPTREMFTKCSLEEFKSEIYVKGKKFDRTDTCKPLGVHMNDHLTWDNHIQIITDSFFIHIKFLQHIFTYSTY